MFQHSIVRAVFFEDDWWALLVCRCAIVPVSTVVHRCNAC